HRYELRRMDDIEQRRVVLERCERGLDLRFVAHEHELRAARPRREMRRRGQRRVRREVASLDVERESRHRHGRYPVVTLLVPFEKGVVKARLVRRYKRFFLDVAPDDGTPIVAHTANTGAMTGLIDAGSPVLLTNHSDNLKRSIPYELEAVRVDGAWV